MTYRIDRNQFIENGPAIAADAAIARVRRAALTAALANQEKARQLAPALKQAA